jgi:S-DNA-T family DNA segregation ATPase FtsK/SpoIIIE
VDGFADTFDKAEEHKQLEQQKIEEIMRKLNLNSANDKEDKEDETAQQILETESAKTEPETVDGAIVLEKPYVYKKPPITLFERGSAKTKGDIENELKTNAQLLVDTLASFGVQTKIIDISRGPSVTRYELQPLAGVKISKITNLADDIALNLAASGVRIEAPIPNKAAVGIEVPNKSSSSVNIRSIFESKEFKDSHSPLSIALGVDIAGNVVVADLTRMPHLLIAGSTGSGKSVCVNAIITSFLYKSSPEDVKLILIDPKVVELAEYNGIPHLLMPVVTEPKKAAGALGSAVAEIEKRYKLFAETGVREIKSYNKLAETRDDLEKLPYVAIIID